jgi:(p)ppGpp synthase/HD superfamily hydrolase
MMTEDKAMETPTTRGQLDRIVSCLKDDFNKAVVIAAMAHDGQVDKGKCDYLCHPLHIAGHFKSKTERIVAILHDVIEDSGLTINDMIDFGFQPIVIRALEAITKKPGEDYWEYINRVLCNRVAIAVKIVDLEHNMDITRMPALTNNDFKRLAKYQKAWAILMTS